MSSAINVPVKVRTHELNQVHDMIPRVEQRLRTIDTETTIDTADELSRIYDEHISAVGVEPRESDEFAAYLSMPADDWRTVMSGISRLYDEEGFRSHWLQKKIVQRLEDRMDEMEDDE